MPGQTVFIIAGEASGDLHASHLARKLLTLDPGLSLKGMGGDNMRRAGVDILIDASNLAVVMAQDGKTVVLVDADLRRPSVHRVFGLSNRVGLTNALVGAPEALSGYLQGTEVQNLQVMLPKGYRPWWSLLPSAPPPP